LAFQAPFIIDHPMIPNSFRKTASEHSVKTIVYEGGESIRLDGPAISYGKNGVLNVLKYLNMLSVSNPNENTVKTSIIKVQKTYWQRAGKS
ncbi:MAG TPA: hypothetical protein PKD85_16185, partial [Saprospiraceae bacterium]|nr:hypothetical protein [Saprospiraceae bacterium]